MSRPFVLAALALAITGCHCRTDTPSQTSDEQDPFLNWGPPSWEVGCGWVYPPGHTFQLTVLPVSLDRRTEAPNTRVYWMRPDAISLEEAVHVQQIKSEGPTHDLTLPTSPGTWVVYREDRSTNSDVYPWWPITLDANGGPIRSDPCCKPLPTWEGFDPQTMSWVEVCDPAIPGDCDPWVCPLSDTTDTAPPLQDTTARSDTHHSGDTAPETDAPLPVDTSQETATP